jgi:hypothetical protein
MQRLGLQSWVIELQRRAKALRKWQCRLGVLGEKRAKNVGKGTAGEREEEMRNQDKYRRMIEGKRKDMNNAENNH